MLHNKIDPSDRKLIGNIMSWNVYLRGTPGFHLGAFTVIVVKKFSSEFWLIGQNYANSACRGGGELVQLALLAKFWPISHNLLENCLTTMTVKASQGPLWNPKAPKRVPLMPFIYTFHYMLCSNEFLYHWDQCWYIKCPECLKMDKYTIYRPFRDSWWP